MAELPELTILQKQMHAALRGRRITEVEITQPKCLNVSRQAAAAALVGRRIDSVSRCGKWLCLNLEPPHHLLLSLGMGADLWHYVKASQRPTKHHLAIALEDGTGFTCRFWWFGHVHSLTPPQLYQHRPTAQLGPSPMEISARQLVDIARKYPRSTVKSLILDQDKLAGIGNAYAHDVLWKAGLAPQRTLATLSDAELTRCHSALRFVVRRAIDKGGLEPDFHQKQGNMKSFRKLFLIGYKERQPCPRCGTPIRKVRAGSTATFLCPTCQPNKPPARRPAVRHRRK